MRVRVSDFFEETAVPNEQSPLSAQTWQAWLSERGVLHLATPAEEFNRWFGRLSEAEREEVHNEVAAERRRLRAELRSEYERALGSSEEGLIRALEACAKARDLEIVLMYHGWEGVPGEGDEEDPMASPVAVEATKAREESERRLEALLGG